MEFDTMQRAATLLSYAISRDGKYSTSRDPIHKLYSDQYDSSFTELAATKNNARLAHALPSNSFCNVMIIRTNPEKTVQHVLNKTRVSKSEITGF